MAITGGRFLALSKAECLGVSRHALSRLRSKAGVALSFGEALELFRQARQVRVDDVFLLGYRPSYTRRLRRGTKSWYFRMAVRGRELIAVIGQSGEEGLVWVTTYGRDVQTDLLRAGVGWEAAGVAQGYL